jgi:hypothetical protein
MNPLRHAPGDRAPVTGRYALTVKSGQRTSRSIWLKTGEPLPPVDTEIVSKLGFSYLLVQEGEDPGH